MCLNLRLFIILIILSVWTAYPAGFIAITEVLKDPYGASSAIPGDLSHEFVEITNLGTMPFSIHGVFLSDGVDADSLMIWAAPLTAHPNCRYGRDMVFPGQTAVILDRDYTAAIQSAPLSALTFTDSTILLTISDDDLGDGLAANDGVFLIKKRTAESDSVIASFCDSGQHLPVTGAKLYQTSPLNVPEGTSIIPKSLLFSLPEYEACPSGTSPGIYEMLTSRWLIEWKAALLINQDTAIQCTVKVYQSSSATHSGTSYRILRGNSTSESIALNSITTDVKGVTSFDAILPLDSVAYQIEITDSQNIITKTMDLSTVWAPAFAIKITEIYPRGDAVVPEWFEITNTSLIPINLNGWAFGNADSRDLLASSDVSLRPGTYAVFTSNKSLFMENFRAAQNVFQPAHWHTLDNYSDTLCLWDADSNSRERVFYDSHWFENWDKQSLQRVAVSADGATAAAWVLTDQPSPGLPNQTETWRNVSRPTMDIGPIPFTPNGDGKDDYLSIRFTLPAASSMRISIFGFDGAEIKTIAGTPQERILWNGKMNNGAPAPAGPFFVTAEIASLNGKKVIRKKGVLWR
jgi:hypothetical protein